MAWIYKKEDGRELRTCDKCKSSQFKTSEGDWAIYLTWERVEHFFKCLLNCEEETCIHTPEPDSD